MTCNFPFTLADLILQWSPDLHDFPFDVQNLPLKVQLVKPWVDRALTILPIEFADLQKPAGFSILPANVSYPDNPDFKLDPPLDGAFHFKAKAIIKLQIRREAGHHLRMHILMQTALTTVGFTSYAVEPEDVGSRLQVIVAAIFTVITVKLTSESDVQTSYPTAQDRYEAVCIRILIAVALAQACTGGVLTRLDASEEVVTFADFIAMAIVVLWWAVYNLCFFVAFFQFSEHASGRAKKIKADTSSKLLCWKQGFKNPDIDVLGRDYTELPKAYSAHIGWVRKDITRKISMRP